MTFQNSQHALNRGVHEFERLIGIVPPPRQHRVTDTAEPQAGIPHGYRHTGAEHGLHATGPVAKAHLSRMQIDPFHGGGLGAAWFRGHERSAPALSARSRARSSAEKTLSISRIMMNRVS